MLAKPDGINAAALQLNLESASFLNGAGLPRVVTLNGQGRIIANDASPAAGISVDDVIVFPGLINSHEHLEFSLYPQLGDPPYVDVDEWARSVHQRYASIVARVEAVSPDIRRYWGLLKNLTSGVTTVMDHANPRGNSTYELPMRTIRPFRFVHRADTRWAWLRARYSRGPGPMVFHVGEGTSAAVRRRSGQFLRRSKARGPLIGVHGISLDAQSARYLDALVWCPVSNLFLFDQTADVASLKETTTILFGTDSGISAHGTIWDHLRVARECGGLSDMELLNSVTTTAMLAWGLASSGDLVIARRRSVDPLESFFNTTPGDICAIISQGQLVLLGEAFYQDIAPDAWHDSYSGITIGELRQRVHNDSIRDLTRLASIRDAPLSLR